MLPFKGRDRRRVAANGAATQHRGDLVLPYRWGSGDRRRLGLATDTATPNDRRSWAFSSLTRPWVLGISSQGSGVESPTGNPEQTEGAAREDLVDLC